MQQREHEQALAAQRSEIEKTYEQRINQLKLKLKDLENFQSNSWVQLGAYSLLARDNVKENDTLRDNIVRISDRVAPDMSSRPDLETYLSFRLEQQNTDAIRVLRGQKRHIDRMDEEHGYLLLSGCKPKRLAIEEKTNDKKTVATTTAITSTTGNNNGFEQPKTTTTTATTTKTTSNPVESKPTATSSEEQDDYKTANPAAVWQTIRNRYSHLMFGVRFLNTTKTLIQPLSRDELLQKYREARRRLKQNRKVDERENEAFRQLNINSERSLFQRCLITSQKLRKIIRDVSRAVIDERNREFLPSDKPTRPENLFERYQFPDIRNSILNFMPINIINFGVNNIYPSSFPTSSVSDPATTVASTAAVGLQTNHPTVRPNVSGK